MTLFLYFCRINNSNMKKTVFIALSCCLLLCGCKREDFVSNTYKAYFEYHIANAANQQSVETLINSWSTVWTSEIELTLINTYTTDAEAYTKFETSVVAVNSKRNSWVPFFDNGDNMVYILKRTTPGTEKILRKVKFDQDGHIVF